VTAGPDPRPPGETTELEARFEALLRFASARAIADLHFKPGLRPLYRRFGELIWRRDDPSYSGEDLAAIAGAWMPAAARRGYDARGHATFVVNLVGCGRFRITAVQSRGAPTLAVRVVPPRVASLRELGLPKAVAQWATATGGLILVSGGPGSGKSSVYGALIDQVNTASASPRQIVSIESQIELAFDDKVAVIHQREVGVDVPDVATALAAAAHQGPDVIGVDVAGLGDLSALVAIAEQPILVIAVVGAGGVVDALRRVAAGQGAELRAALARRLRGVVHTALVGSADGKGLVPACEVLQPSAAVIEILRGDRPLDALQAVIDAPAARAAGMIGLDHALVELVQAGAVGFDPAIAAARDPDTVRARLTGVRSPTTVVAQGAPLPAIAATAAAEFKPA